MDAALLRALLPVVEALRSLGARYRIGGSVASSAHGVARTTIDVDLVAELTPDQVEPLVERLRDAYYIEAIAIRRALRTRSCFNALHFATSIKVDVFVPKNRDYDREAMGRQVSVRAAGEPPAAALDFSTPEDVVLAKLEWYRSGGETSERQWADVLGLLRVQRGRLDETYLDRWAPELGVADLLDRARAEAAQSG